MDVELYREMNRWCDKILVIEIFNRKLEKK